MAKRIATEYVSASFELSGSELQTFIGLMEEQQLHLQILVLENGNQTLLIEDVAGHEGIRMTFERQADQYVCQISCTIIQLKLTNALRKAVSVFRGDAIVNRKYSTYTIQYHYKQGKVGLIVEISNSGSRIVFQKKDTVQQLQHLFHRNMVESEIKLLHQHVDGLLDQRNRASSHEALAEIDEQLQQITNKLFRLEAN